MPNKRKWQGLGVERTGNVVKGPRCRCNNDQYEHISITTKSKDPKKRVKNVYAECTKCKSRYFFGRMVSEHEEDCEGSNTDSWVLYTHRPRT